MRKRLLAALGVALLTTGSSHAILQVDICQPLPDCVSIDDVSVTMYLFGIPMEYPATMLAGPDGFPLCYHLIFNYDGVVPGGAVERVEICIPCVYGEVCQVWEPPFFTIFYQPGPAFPVTWDTIEPWPADCCETVAAAELPAVFSLADAAPNPFNPTTMIEFSLPATDAVRLDVFNIDGQRVRTLVDGTLARGPHIAVFDAGSLSSGVYVYSLESSAGRLTRKMVLVK